MQSKNSTLETEGKLEHERNKADRQRRVEVKCESGRLTRHEIIFIRSFLTATQETQKSLRAAVLHAVHSR